MIDSGYPLIMLDVPVVLNKDLSIKTMTGHHKVNMYILYIYTVLAKSGQPVDEGWHQLHKNLACTINEQTMAKYGKHDDKEWMTRIIPCSSQLQILSHGQ